MWQMLSQVVPLVINLGLTPYFISGLGHDRYSVFLLVNTMTMLLGTFDGGLGQSALRFFTINAGRGDRAASTRLLTTVSAVFLVGTAIIFSIVFVFADRLLGFFSVSAELLPETLFLLRTMTLLTAFMLLRNLYNSLLYANGRFPITASALLAGHLTYAAGMILTIQSGWGLRGAAWTFVVQQIVGTLITVPVAIPLLDRAGFRLMSRLEAAEFFRYAWKIQLTGLITMITTQKDQLVAGRMLSAQQSGPYGQGSNFAQQLRMIPLNATAPMQALVGRAVGSVGPQAARARVNAVQRTWVRAVVAWYAVGVPAAYFGVRTWLPDSFAVSAQVAAILFLGTAFSVLPLVLIQWVLTLGHPDVQLRYSLVGLAANIVISIALTLPFGIIGSVLGTAVSQVIAAVWLSFDARRTVGVQLAWFGRDVPWVPALLACGLTAVLEFLLAGFFPRGGPGLVLCGLLAVPGLLGYGLGVFGRVRMRAMAARLPVVGRFFRR